MSNRYLYEKKIETLGYKHGETKVEYPINAEDIESIKRDIINMYQGLNPPSIIIDKAHQHPVRK